MLYICEDNTLLLATRKQANLGKLHYVKLHRPGPYRLDLSRAYV